MRPVIRPSDDDKPVDRTPQSLPETDGYITGLEAAEYMRDITIQSVTPPQLPEHWSDDAKDAWDRGYLHGRAELGPEDNN